MSNEFTPSYEVLREEITKSLTHPDSIDENGLLQYNVVSDPFMLKCGCILSHKFAISLTSNSKLSCPICQTFTELGYELAPLKNLYNVLYPQQNLMNNKKESLLSLFYTVANEINEQKSTQPIPPQESSLVNPKTLPTHNTSSASTSSSLNETIPIATTLMRKPSSIHSSTSVTTSSFIPSLQPQANPSDISSISPPETSIQSYFNKSPPDDTSSEQKEYLFVKCFPTYRRHYQYHTHSKFMKTKSKNFINNSISPSSKYFALITPKKWEVFKISPNSNVAPTLYCCGKSTGEYGASFEMLNKPNSKEFHGGQAKTCDEQTLKKKISDWEHLYCSISDDFLVISGTGGVFRIIDLNRKKPIYLYFSSFPIRCMEISSNSQLIAYGITGKDRISGSEQALVVLHKLSPLPTTSTPETPSAIINEDEEESFYKKMFGTDPITVTFPYRDPINQLSFSNDSNYLSCSTALESRFLTIWVKNYMEPKLVMKSLRNLDTSLESEGITDVRMFPNNQHMIITSASFNATPIIIDNNIASINGLQTVAQPKLLIKLDEIGSSIHKSAISPRNDTMALLDRNGTVYLVFATKMEMESKRIFMVDQVSNAFRRRECASLQFSKDGYKLYCLDRKGIFYINDFAAGLPNQSQVTRCKPLLWGT